MLTYIRWLLRGVCLGFFQLSSGKSQRIETNGWLWEVALIRPKHPTGIYREARTEVRHLIAEPFSRLVHFILHYLRNTATTGPNRYLPHHVSFPNRAPSSRAASQKPLPPSTGAAVRPECCCSTMSTSDKHYNGAG
jgi:hypothetical protein